MIEENKLPLVSILVTVYNGMPFIERTLDHLLSQTYDNFEIVIVDDGSEDGTIGFLQETASKNEKIKLVQSKRIGRGKALNLALSNCQGKYVAINDADDFSKPERLEKQVRFLEKNSDYVLVGSQLEIINLKNQQVIPDTFRFRPIQNGDIRKYFLKGQPIQHSSAMMRKSVIGEIGGYNGKLDFLYDRDIFIRLMEKGKLHNLPEVLIQLGRHESQFFFHTYTGRKRLKQDFYFRLKAAKILQIPVSQRIKIWLWQQWSLLPENFRNNIKYIFTKNKKRF